MRHVTRIALFVALILVCNAALACPGCKEAVADPNSKPSPQALMASGYGWSIIFMLGTVLSLIGTAFFSVYRIVSAEEKRLAAAEKK